MKTGVLAKSGNGGRARLWPILKPHVTVGRAMENDVALADASVSRAHAVIEARDGDWSLADLDSRNGTRVNGVAVARRLLRDGDVVSFGDVALAFHVTDEEPAPALAAEPRGRTAGLSRTVAAPGEPAPDAAWPGLHAWQMLKALSAGRARTPDEFARAALGDVTGIRQVRSAGVGLRVEPGGAWRWIWQEGAEPGARAFGEEAAATKALREGRAAYGARGRLTDGESGADSLCYPIPAPDRTIGCLCVQGRDAFPESLRAIFRAAAEALGMALGLREGWARQAARAEEADAAGAARAPAIVGRSPALMQAVRLATRAARSEATVLLRGETGTGKELFARLIVVESARRDRVFIPVHCSAIDENLLGSTLFGHEKGAFTGAVGMKRGVFEEADGGTVFLDEIGELSPGMQVKLLRVLQEGEFMRLGGAKPIRVQVRVIAATNRDLERAMREGTFREDFFYRLNVVALTLPPLRERRPDIGELARYFLEGLSREMGRSAVDLTAEARARLEAYGWPGNIRELRNVIERGLVLAEGDRITEDDLPPEVAAGAGLDRAEAGTLERTEQAQIARVLGDCGGNKRLAARRLGISRSTLYEKLKER